VIVALVTVACLVGPACSTERSDPTPPDNATTAPVVVVDVANVTITAGASAIVRIPVTVVDGYRIQANPPSSPFLVPLELRLDPAEGLEFGEPLYPEGQPYRLQGSDEDLSTYRGALEIVLPITATDDDPGSTRTVRGSLHFQACDSRVCLFPASVPVTLTVAVIPS
jgi:hypothetical protein